MGKNWRRHIIGRLCRLAGRMPQWDRATLDKFIEAEAALVNRQLSLAASSGEPGPPWRQIGQGVFSEYGGLLADERFDEIAELTRKL